MKDHSKLKGVKSPSEEQWQQLLVAFRETPGACKDVARRVGVTEAAALKAWTVGFIATTAPSVPVREPIMRVLEREIELARAARHRGEEALIAANAKLRSEAMQDAITARKEELDMVKAGRRNALLGLIAANKLLQATQALADEVRRRTADQATVRALDVADITRLLNVAGLLSMRTVEIADHIVLLERRIAGEPSEVIGVRVSGDLNVSTAQLADEIRQAVGDVRRSFATHATFPATSMPKLPS